MKMSVKAALFSGLVFPGAGHLILKRYARAFVLCALTLLALCFIVNDVMLKASAIADKILSGAVSADATAIIALVADSGVESNMVDIAGYVILACWIAGILDSYRIGRMKDKAEDTNNGPQSS